MSLPRRSPDWSKEQSERAVRLMTQWLKTPEGTMTLMPIQARCLVELHDTGCLAGPQVGAGQGKTLISALAATVTKSYTTLLLVPAALRDKTYAEFEDLAEHWQLPYVIRPEDTITTTPKKCPLLYVLAYETLSSVRYASYLEVIAPDLIIADEAHALQSMKSGRSRRVFRYIKNARKEGKKVTFIPLTATGWSTKLSQVSHLLGYSLQDKSPLPRDYFAIESWGKAVDQGVRPQERIGVGALAYLCPDKQPTLENARNGIRDRIVETPGIIISRESACPIPLVLQRREVTPPDDVIEAMQKLREDYMLPNGDPCEGGVVFWNHARELANGFCYQYEVPPPADWRQARSDWVAFCRRAMSLPSKQLDTPLAVWQAVVKGVFGNVPEFDAWVAIRDTFKPKTKPLWVNDYLIKDAEQWALDTGGIVWVMHSTAHTYEDQSDEDLVGGQFTRIPYFGAGDEKIRSHKGPCVASVRSHGTGKNLQQWDRALLMSMPSSNKTLEQLLARIHRTGQKSDLVKFEFYVHSLENLNALEKCMADAEFVQQTSGAPQRILDAYILDVNNHKLDIEAYRERMLKNKNALWG